MIYNLIPSKFFLKQLDLLSSKSLKIVESKLLLLKSNPFRFKRIVGQDIVLFRIRFSELNKDKRIIYLVDGNKIKVLCILDRKNNYSDLKNYLLKCSY